jgi:hypothetical protein
MPLSNTSLVVVVVVEVVVAVVVVVVDVGSRACRDNVESVAHGTAMA